MNAGTILVIAIVVLVAIVFVTGPVYEAIRDHRNRFGGRER